ncbi:MAG: ATP-binding protein, partial [Aestuariivirga sp.]
MAKKPVAKAVKKRKILATGGGNATASGVSFQASVAAYFASQGLAEAPLDARLGLGTARPTGFRFETEAPVDDILISLDEGGWAFIQGKNSLTNSASLTSELGKTCDEFARLWEAASAGSGARDWDRPLTAGLDVIVIAVGPTTSGTIKHHLARALDVARDGSSTTLSQDQKNALASFRKLMGAALTARGVAVASVNPDEILKFVHVLDFDFGGAHRTTAETVLANALTNRSSAPAALTVLEKECERRMAARNGVSLAGLRAELARSGVSIAAPADYRSDIVALKERTSRVAGALQDFERTRVSGKDITISRACARACVIAAKEDSIVVVGDPGAGKSAVVNETARQLSAEGSDVVLLDVDRLQVESVEGLNSALRISHPLSDVLANWPGSGPAYLILDALDACRFGRSEALFRTVMQEVLELSGGRWRIVASIRTFDLMVGQEFGRLFRGVPPSPEYTDQRFQTVRHMRVPEWSDVEFEELLTKIPALRIAVDNGGPKLAELARVPFNTRLLADLLTEGVAPEQLRNLRSQVQLLELYWNKRVRPLGLPAEQCLANSVIAMLDRGRMEATRIAAGAGTGNALDQLLQSGVFNSVNGDQDVAFRHHILFDYVASRTVVDLDKSATTNELLKRSGANLLLAPAISFALQHLWETSGSGRDRFWQAVADFAGDGEADPVARIVAARVGCDFPSEADDSAGLVRLMTKPTERKRAFGAFRHIVGSLSVRLEDEASVPPAPWCSIAEAAAPFVTEIAWPLRTLIHNLIDRVTDPNLRRQIGVAARSVMDYAFAEGGEMLMSLAIGFVAKTFGTDPAASQRLMERLLEPGRMKAHAANDMHWLAREVVEIAAHDAELVVQI